ncbi:MAG: efflux RND transporter periplasmic adaptor subunit [Spirochaetaceae bacterium]
MKRISSVLVAAGILLLASGLAGCGGSSEPEASQETQAVPVRTETVEPRTFVEYGEYYGEVRAAREARLVSVAGGRVTEITASVGDSVETGRSLARVDAGQVVSRYETARESERIARKAYEREQRFLEVGNSSPVAVDNAHLAWLEARSRLLDAEKARDGALAVSPLDGMVVAKHIDLYDELPPGAPTFTVADTAQMKVTVGVPESDMAAIGEPGNAEVRLSSVPGRVWTGRPAGVSRKRSDHSLTFDVEILVDNPDGALLSGSTANVRLALREMPDAVVVPSHVVQTRRTESFVMVANSTTARRVAVTIGPSSDTHTVIASGLEPGDQLITEGINQVGDGSTVRIVE